MSAVIRPDSPPRSHREECPPFRRGAATISSGIPASRAAAASAARRPCVRRRTSAFSKRPRDAAAARYFGLAALPGQNDVLRSAASHDLDDLACIAWNSVDDFQWKIEHSRFDLHRTQAVRSQRSHDIARDLGPLPCDGRNECRRKAARPCDRDPRCPSDSVPDRDFDRAQRGRSRADRTGPPRRGRQRTRRPAGAGRALRGVS